MEVVVVLVDVEVVVVVVDTGSGTGSSTWADTKVAGAAATAASTARPRRGRGSGIWRQGLAPGRSLYDTVSWQVESQVQREWRWRAATPAATYTFAGKSRATFS